MRYSGNSWIFVLLLPAFLALKGQGGEPPPPVPEAAAPTPKLPEKIPPAKQLESKDLLPRLGSESFEEREEATVALIQKGLAALEEISTYEKDTQDEEVKVRCGKIREAIVNLAQIAGESSLKTLGWEISKGKWMITPEKILVGELDASTQVVTIKRELKRFKSISVELRGDGESTGFSFGASGSRFVIKPGKNWQKLTLEVDASDSLKLLVDGALATSADPVDCKTANQLPDYIFLRSKGGRVEFRNFSVDGQLASNHSP